MTFHRVWQERAAMLTSLTRPFSSDPFSVRPERRHVHPKPQPSSISTAWAQHLDEIREAQKLRYEIFAEEMGASLDSPLPGFDVDEFDDYCQHLLVRDRDSGQLVGTYRVLTPDLASRLDSTYTDREFDLTELRAIRSGMIEVGRSCVHRDHRHGGVILALWSALGSLMVHRHWNFMLGCASIPLMSASKEGGDLTASIWHHVQQDDMAPIEYRVKPRHRFPVEQYDSTLDVEPPPMLKGYLRIGVKVLGAPAWDPAFDCADLPVMMDLSQMPERYRKRFLGSRSSS